MLGRHRGEFVVGGNDRSDDSGDFSLTMDQNSTLAPTTSPSSPPFIACLLFSFGGSCPLGSGLDLARLREKFSFNGGGLPNVLFKGKSGQVVQNPTFRVEAARNRVTLEFHGPGNATAVRWRTLMCVVSRTLRAVPALRAGTSPFKVTTSVFGCRAE